MMLNGTYKRYKNMTQVYPALVMDTVSPTEGSPGGGVCRKAGGAHATYEMLSK